ncbi:MAG: hypothetical protein ACE5E7_13595 [Anaerolineae bacterium]
MGSHSITLAFRLLPELGAIAALVVAHYLVSYDRVAWLIRQ